VILDNAGNSRRQPSWNLAPPPRRTPRSTSPPPCRRQIGFRANRARYWSSADASARTSF